MAVRGRDQSRKTVHPSDRLTFHRPRHPFLDATGTLTPSIRSHLDQRYSSSPFSLSRGCYRKGRGMSCTLLRSRLNLGSNDLSMKNSSNRTSKWHRYRARMQAQLWLWDRSIGSTRGRDITSIRERRNMAILGDIHQLSRSAILMPSLSLSLIFHCSPRQYSIIRSATRLHPNNMYRWIHVDS